MFGNPPQSEYDNLILSPTMFGIALKTCDLLDYRLEPADPPAPRSLHTVNHQPRVCWGWGSHDHPCWPLANPTELHTAGPADSTARSSSHSPIGGRSASSSRCKTHQHEDIMPNYHRSAMLAGCWLWQVATANMNLSDEVDLEHFVSRPDKLSGAGPLPATAPSSSLLLQINYLAPLPPHGPSVRWSLLPPPLNFPKIITKIGKYD